MNVRGIVVILVVAGMFLLNCRWTSRRARGVRMNALDALMVTALAAVLMAGIALG